ncbi:MAG TPA: adenylate/guanylate cyclase domain-containing protein, partial [Mycobacterium sp.]|nr:adenylate/guanylate cyclase domain-containing protein [Mycobacterium sp.]
EPGHVLASAIAVSGALDAEALCWDVGEVVELRGRRAPTQLARPVHLAETTESPPPRARTQEMSGETIGPGY